VAKSITAIQILTVNSHTSWHRYGVHRQMAKHPTDKRQPVGRIGAMG